MKRDLDALSECHDCGLLQELPGVDDGGLVTCERCGALLRQVRHFSFVLSSLCSLLGLALLGMALLFPLASMTIQGGRIVTSNVMDAVTLLEKKGFLELAVAAGLTLFIFPAAKLLCVLAMAGSVLAGRAPFLVKRIFTTLPSLSAWAMVDVFLLGAMIALFRMRSWGHVTFGAGLFALGGVALCCVALDAAFDPRDFWRRLPRGGFRLSSRSSLAPAEPLPPPGPSGARQSAGQPDDVLSLVGCEHCGLVAEGGDGHWCPRCERRLHRRKRGSINRTWAMVAGGFLLFIPANVLPVMSVTKLGRGGTKTIWSGVIELTQDGLYGLAFIVFVASLVVPLLKLVALSVLLVMTMRRSDAYLALRTKLYRVVAVIGRWSMVDIFAMMTLVAVGRFGFLGQVLPAAGAVAFCAVVIVTMIASESFDPRVMWDMAGRNAMDGRSAEPPDRPAERVKAEEALI